MHLDLCSIVHSYNAEPFAAPICHFYFLNKFLPQCVLCAVLLKASLAGVAEWYGPCCCQAPGEIPSCLNGVIPWLIDV